jgi:hypothetical protein
MKKLFAVWAVLVVVVAGVIAAQPEKPAAPAAQDNRPHFRALKGAQLGASGQVVTTVNKSVSPSPGAFYYSALSKSFTSSVNSVFDQGLIGAGTTSGIMTASGTGSMQFLYAYSSALDGTLSIYGNTSGTGSAISGGTLALTAGVPYEWDSATSGATALMLASSNSISFTAGTTAGGLATSTTSTTFNASALYP